MTSHVHTDADSEDMKRQKNVYKNPMQGQFQYPPGQYQPGPQLFEDTSTSYPHQYPQAAGGPGMDNWNPAYGTPQYPMQQLLTDPMASMAMQYGQTIAGQGKVMMEEKLEKYVSVSKMKYYFAVDTGYVMKKLGLIFFPFTHKEWSVHYNNQNEPVPPRYDVNAPDLYIPSMAFVTYILAAGYILGSQNRFTPEQLGMQASSAMGWSMVEIFILFLALYVLNALSSLKVLDLIAFCSYKYVCMVAVLLGSAIFKTAGYYSLLAYSSISLGFFLLKTLRMMILPKTTTDHYSSSGRHNSYLLLAICIIQPLMMYTLTRHLALASVPNSV